jgi:allophanate hydrolase subunit 2
VSADRGGEVERAPGGFADDGSPIRVIAGPDRVAGTLETLCAGDYQISPASDRVGTRLVGPALSPGGDGASRPMVKGAIEVPPDGAPIVLGPEHPTTGGYPVIAVIASVDLGRFFARRIGARVRFTSAAAR